MTLARRQIGTITTYQADNGLEEHVDLVFDYNAGHRKTLYTFIGLP